MRVRTFVVLLLGIPAGLSGAQETAAADRALREGRYDEAVAAYRRAVERAPHAAGPTRGLVAALREVGRYEEAIAAAAAYARHRPSSAELATPLGEALLLVGRRAEAEAAFTRAAQEGARDSLTARLNLALLRLERGDVSDARRLLGTFIAVYNRGAGLAAHELTAVATAVRYLARWTPGLAQDALRAYDKAIAADSADWEPQLRVGELFLEKYNAPDARATFDGILARNPGHPRALLGLARTERFEGSAEAMALVRRALEVNPNLVPARVFLAQLHAESESYGWAARELARALRTDSTSLDAWAVLAAVRYLEGDTAAWRDAERRALALNPRDARLYVTLAEMSARNRLYHDAVRFARRAVALDSSAWRGYAVLGINQLRVGEIAAGRANLERAFRGDPFDVWTRNTLELLDDLVAYPETRTPRFRFYAAAQESGLLSLYAGPLAEAAFDSLAHRYGYGPPTPIRVELFPRHADFSVRTLGLVGLGALGVSFGPVIAMDSPSAREAAAFNWGSTLWHELAHTFHLGLTAHRVPRWFTEGLAVYEERKARPGWGQDVTPAFLAAYQAGRLKPVSALNDGFLRPEYPEQVLFSYYQASLVCELIEREHGTRAITELLAGYRAGGATAELFEQVLGEGLDAFDRRFERYLERRFGTALAALARATPAGPPPSREEIVRRARDTGDYAAQAAMGRLLVEEGRDDEAVGHLERAKALFPEYAGPGSPYPYLAQVHRRRGDLDRAAAELHVLTSINGDDYDAHLELADVLILLGRRAEAAAVLERSMYISPFDPDRHGQLAGLYEELGRLASAVRERQAVVALDPVDRAEAHYQLARTLLSAGDTAGARRSVLHALEQAPGFEAAQELLLRIHGRQPR